VPPFLPPLLAAAVLTGLSFLVSYPLQLKTLRIDVLALFLSVFALVNLRLAFRQAGRRGAGAQTAQKVRTHTVQPPLWFWAAALLLAAAVTLRVVRALSV
jgi:hypothetical protein